MTAEAIRLMLANLERAMVEVEAKEKAATEARLRQEGAILALRQLLQQAAIDAAGAEAYATAAIAPAP
jgi:hypothetical protein